MGIPETCLRPNKATSRKDVKNGYDVPNADPLRGPPQPKNAPLDRETQIQESGIILADPNSVVRPECPRVLESP